MTPSQRLKFDLKRRGSSNPLIGAVPPFDDFCKVGQRQCNKTSNGGISCTHNGKEYFVKGYEGCPWEKFF